jgi:hypothetical protein
MGCLEGIGVPVLYIGRTVSKGFSIYIYGNVGPVAQSV